MKCNQKSGETHEPRRTTACLLVGERKQLDQLKQLSGQQRCTPNSLGPQVNSLVSIRARELRLSQTLNQPAWRTPYKHGELRINRLHCQEEGVTLINKAFSRALQDTLHEF